MILARKIQRYGWKPSLPDHRDYKMAVDKQAALPIFSDLRLMCPSVYDQGMLGSCTSNATAALAQFIMMKRWTNPSHAFTPSRLFNYYNERAIEGTIDVDSGATLRDGMKVLNKEGAPQERFWPYDVVRFKMRPGGNVFFDAKKHKIGTYLSVSQTHDSIVQVLASDFPIVFGFSAYESLESQRVADAGAIPLPKKNEEQIGGHAVMIVGHDDDNRFFLIRNSWSAYWGMDGYATMPYDYVLNPDLAGDFWTATTIS